MKEGFAYVLRHAWFWPLVFWLRPLDVVERAKELENGWVEVVCATLGGAIWGVTAGLVLWLWADVVQGIWVLSAAVAGVVAVTAVVSGVGAVTVVDAVLVAAVVAGAITVAVAGAVTVAVAGAITVAVAGVVGISVAVTAVITVSWYLFVVVAGFAVASLLPVATEFILAGARIAVFSIAIYFLFFKIKKGLEWPEWASVAFTGAWFIGLPIAAFARFPASELNQVPIWGLSLACALGYSFLVGFCHKTLSDADKTDINFAGHSQMVWLALFWILFLILALAAWLPDPESVLNEKLDQLALFAAVSAPFFTGLPFWPLIAVTSLWQFRSNNVQLYTAQRFVQTIPFRWQTFAYPLPRLRRYLRELGRQRGPDAALIAIQVIQLRTLQILAARRAVWDLAADAETALPFCGQVAITTNNATLVPLSLSGPAARAIAVLTRKEEREDEQPLMVFVANFPPRSSRIPFLNRSKALSWLEEFEITREDSLNVRIAYALKEIDACSSCAEVNEFRSLLEAFQRRLQINELEALRGLPRISAQEIESYPAWLRGGWQVLAAIDAFLDAFDAYQELSSQQARREFLNRKIGELHELSWNELPAYWRNIWIEMRDDWIDLLTQEATEAREWLRLEVESPGESLRTGQQALELRVYNPTSVLAQKVWIRVDDTPGIDWHHKKTRQNFIEGGQTVPMRLELDAENEGRYRVTGELGAEDLAGNPFSLPFAFKIDVAQAGRAYRLQDIQPYSPAGGLGDDRTFVGRTELLHRLRSLWLQPYGKPAVVLVGQRRIGKTSLLNKIVRDGLPGTHLTPVLIDVQGVSGEYDFLNDAACRTAEALHAERPVLDRGEPYAGFKAFLSALKPRLDGRRILLMLDEADLIPARHLGDQLPGFLRSLMQGPDYPTLLLFCGTHALKRMGREYDSILFNTAQFQTVSYMTEGESAEVLQKPARDILEFDPLTLEQAYRMTRGQPLLLQSLGAMLIRQFDAVVLKGGERSDYVTPADLDRAAGALVEQGNAAFENHWQDVDPATHRLLSTLAWATHETHRRQLDLSGIEAALRETRLGLPPGSAFKIVERLSDEEILFRDGPAYSFAVHLYRRWIAWRWPPERVRGELVS